MTERSEARGGVARWLELIMHRLNEKCNKKNINNSSNSKDLWSSAFGRRPKIRHVGD